MPATATLTAARSDQAGPPLLQIDGALTRITLRRPRLANRLELEDLQTLRDQLDRLNRDEAVRVLLLQAEGLWAGRPEQRLQRLSQRVDDAYSEWQLRRQDPAHAARTAQLQQQLRSPRQPGGHASPQP